MRAGTEKAALTDRLSGFGFGFRLPILAARPISPPVERGFAFHVLQRLRGASTAPAFPARTTPPPGDFARPRRYAAVAAGVWTGVVGLSAAWNVHQIRLSGVELALGEARSAAKREEMHRQWVDRQGGVYVPVSEEVWPDPNLAHLPERDVRTPSGRRLTLVVSTRVTNQVYALARLRGGIDQRLTSLNPVRPTNTPSGWEREALRKLEKGAPESRELVVAGGRKLLRLMIPLYVDESCSLCHAKPGMQVGDVGGGLSMTIPMARYEEAGLAQMRPVLLGHLGIWILGLTGIGLGTQRLECEARERDAVAASLQESEARYRAITEGTPVGIWQLDLEGRTIYANPALCAMIETDSLDELRRINYDMFCAAEDREILKRQDERRLRGEAGHYELTVMGLRGGRRRVLVYGAPLLGPDGVPWSRIGTLVDVTDLRRAETARNRLFHLSLDLICIAELDGTIRELNSGPVRALGWDERDLIGRPVEEFVHADDRERLRSLIAELATGHALAGEEIRFLAANGSFRWFACNATPLLEEGLFYAVCRDVTEASEARTALQAAKDAAEEANRLKSEFLANISHEIRTPLNGVLGMAGLLVDSGLDGEAGEFARTIQASAETLQGLVNDVLDFSKVEAGRMEVEKVPVDVRRVVGEVENLLVLRARQKGLRLASRVDEAVPARLLGDPGRIRQVLLNLVANAIKFTPRGRVDVSVTLETSRDAGNRLRVTVTDTGIGIPPDRLPLLFQPFVQADASTTRCFGGTGLGLSISKGLVEMMGGEIGAESVPGQGSRFWFTLPVAEPAAQAEEPMEPAPPPEQGEPPALPRKAGQTGRVLVVEDNGVNQKVLVAQLHRLGYHADVAGDGREAIGLLSRTPYQLVLMDCHMPDMDGFAAARAIRRPDSEVLNPSIPIVAITAGGLSGERRRCLEAGMNDFLPKPVAIEELAEKVATALSGHADGATGPRNGPAKSPGRNGKPPAGQSQGGINERRAS